MKIIQTIAGRELAPKLSINKKTILTIVKNGCIAIRSPRIIMHKSLYKTIGVFENWRVTVDG